MRCYLMLVRIIFLILSCPAELVTLIRLKLIRM